MEQHDPLYQLMTHGNVKVTEDASRLMVVIRDVSCKIERVGLEDNGLTVRIRWYGEFKYEDTWVKCRTELFVYPQGSTIDLPPEGAFWEKA